MTVSLFLFVFTASRLDSDGLKKMGESEVLTLSTIHGAKGLEFSHVWLVQMAEVCTICILCLPLYVHLYPGLFLSIHLSLRYNLCAVKGLLCVDVMNQTINE